MLWGRSMTEAERERLSRNLAEVIDDLYRQHAPPRDHERLIQLVQVQIRHAIVACGTQRAPRPGAAAMTDIPHDHLGQPDLQALVRQCGGFDKISLRVGSLQRRMAGAPSCRTQNTADLEETATIRLVP